MLTLTHSELYDRDRETYEYSSGKNLIINFPNLFRIPGRVVLGQLHELVQQIRLIEIGGQRTQLLVRGQILAENGSSW